MAGSRSSGRYVVAPLALGSVAAGRNISLWPFGGSSKPEAAAPVVEAPVVEIPAKEQVTEKINAALAPSTPTAHEALQTTSPDTLTAAAAPAVPSDFDLAAIADLGSANILNMPEDIGYLSKLGLDYGWGPTSVMQWTLEHVHVYSGWGWGASIVATALLLRVAMFYPQIRALKFNAAMTKMRADPRGKEAMDLVKQGYQTGDKEMLQKGQFMNKMLKEEYGAATTGMLWSFLQIPFSFGLFRIIGGMAHIPVPALETSGFLWFQDLTATDPYFVLPAIGSGLLFGALLVNSKYAPPQQKDMMKKMMWVFGTVGFIGTTFLSAGVNLMMVSTGSATLLTAVTLNNDTVRRAVGLPILQVQAPVYKAPRPPTAPGITGLRQRLEHNLGDMKKGWSEQVSNYTGQHVGTDEERAEKKRKETLKKMEEMRKQMERDEFQKKYKGRQ